MQLLPPLTSDPKVIAREKAAGDHLPYARHMDDRTIETRDGLLMQALIERCSGRCDATQVAASALSAPVPDLSLCRSHD
ncbi:hypothetical protein DAH66_17605 [Sphingomonas koreensis]|uniref:Uncharacterized protein n=1 Tax=Sphingomonas koreensis TaxID=93064 RepID=A0A430G046_9SPHN|nr:hypothetical protein DAH66_17605 [Sphingomonas koreensis]